MSGLRRRCFLVLILVFFCLPSLSYGFDLAQVSSRIQQIYEDMSSMQASFEQTSSLQGMRHRQEYGKGTLIIQKPDKLRWDYVEPEYKVLVSDGIDISFYVRADKQIFISPAKDYLQEDLTYRFFTGKADLRSDFLTIKGEAEMEEKGTYCLKLTPKKISGQVAHLYIWVDTDTMHLVRLQLVDQLNTVTDFRFTDIIMDKKYPESVFEFTAPSGTEIILPGGEIVIQ